MRGSTHKNGLTCCVDSTCGKSGSNSRSCSDLKQRDLDSKHFMRAFRRGKRKVKQTDILRSLPHSRPFARAYQTSSTSDLNRVGSKEKQIPGDFTDRARQSSDYQAMDESQISSSVCQSTYHPSLFPQENLNVTEECAQVN